MLKKFLVIALLASCSTAFAEGTMTEQLKASIDPNNVRIVYDVYGNASWLNRFTFAQRGKDFYIQKDYPIFQEIKYKHMGFMGFGGIGRANAPVKKKPIENKTGRKPIRFNDYRGEPIDYVNELLKEQYNACVFGRTEPDLTLLKGGIIGELAIYAEEETKKRKGDLFDLCIGHDNKIYFLSRGIEKGGWTNAEDATWEKLRDRPKNFLREHFLESNAIKDVLLATPKDHEIKYIQTYEQIIDNELCVAEEFTSQELTEQGLPQGKEMHFKFYYKDGKLAYFDRDDKNYAPEPIVKYGIVYRTPSSLNRVIALDQNVDNYVFDSLRHYDTGELRQVGK